MNNEFYHHGIKGQRWGVRRYQNPDGTLTSEGRQRYLQGDINSGFAIFTKTGKKEYGKVAKQNRKRAQEAVKEELNKSDNGKTIQQASDDLNKYANDYADQVKEKSKSLVGNKEFKKKVYDQYTKQYGDVLDIVSDSFDDDIFEIASDLLDKEFSNDKQMSTTLSNYNKATDKYWNTISDVAQKATNKIGNESIISYENSPFVAQGKQAVHKIVRDTVNTSWNSHVNRHFDDYWVNEQIDDKVYRQFTLDDYKKTK